MPDIELVDLLLALVIVLGAWGGWRRGVLQSGFELVTLAASLVLAFAFYPEPVRWVQGRLAWLGPWLPPLSFILIFVLAQLAISAVLHRLVRGVPLHVQRHVVSRALGVLPGTANGLIHAVVVAAVLTALPLTGTLGLLTREGALGALLVEPAEWLEARLATIFDPAVERVLRARTVPAESTEYVKLRFNVRDAPAREALEARMVELVNADRVRIGLSALKSDPELTQVAREHSRDMLMRGYFAHVSPEGEDVGGRLRRHKARYLVAGENLALAQTLTIAHNGLMRSPGHRANILRPQYGRIGIGVLDGGTHGLMVTQVFRN